MFEILCFLIVPYLLLTKAIRIKHALHGHAVSIEKGLIFIGTGLLILGTVACVCKYHSWKFSPHAFWAFLWLPLAILFSLTRSMCAKGSVHLKQANSLTTATCYFILLFFLYGAYQDIGPGYATGVAMGIYLMPVIVVIACLFCFFWSYALPIKNLHHPEAHNNSRDHASGPL